jgi:hypothetical protein
MEDAMATEAMTGGRAERVPFPLQQSEEILTVCRRHWIHLWPRTVLYVLFALVPLVVIALILGQINRYDDVQVFFWLVSAAWGLFWLLRIYLNWYQYHNDIWVITNQRIVDSIKKHPFSHRLSTADLVNVQDMTVERKGVLQTMLNYGDIVCETASDGGEFVLAGIPRPQDVQLLVDRERDRERKGR